MLIPADAVIPEEEEEEPLQASVAAVHVKSRKRRFNWLSESYMLQFGKFRTAINALSKQHPDIELFAQPDMHLMSNWVGPGSSRPDAFQISWSYPKVGMIYCNPPWSKLARTAYKICQDRAWGIAVIPHWESKKWFRRFMKMATDGYRFNGNTSIFENADGKLPGPGYDIWCLLVDGSRMKIKEPIEDYVPKCPQSKTKNQEAEDSAEK